MTPKEIEERARQEEELKAATDEHFRTHTQLMRTPYEERMFEAGFKAGWARRKPPCKHTYMFFGDYPKKRCATCSELEPEESVVSTS